MPVNKRLVTVGLIQAKAHKDPSLNLLLTLERAEKAAKDGAQIICTQELFSTQYFCQSEDHSNFKIAEPIPGPITEKFQIIAQRYKVVIIVSLFEKRGSGVYHNSAAIINTDGSLLGVYRKMHIPDDPLYYEKFYFTPGDLGFQTWETTFGTIGILICWDQWYPEAARLTAMQGAEIIFYPTAIGWHPSEKSNYGKRQYDAWETIQRSHAIANGCYVASVNRTGHERTIKSDGIEFWGQSFIAGTSGEVLKKANLEETTLLCDLDLGKVEVTRTHWPFMRDRRIDAYSGITKLLLDD